MNNIPVMAEELKKQISQFVETECGGEDVSDLESEMYKQLWIAIGTINDFLATQKMEGRKFEVGKSYYDKWYDLRIVEKRLDSGNIRLKGAYGISKVNTDSRGNEYISGVYTLKA